MPDLRELIDLHDRLVAACSGVVDVGTLEAEAEVGRAARRRYGYLGETTVVALAGGTGSGKSSLLNAIAGEEVSPPGARRPTTSEPVAWIPSNPEPGVTRLLDDIGVVKRVGQVIHPWLAIIDLPDTDSVVEDHRQTVDRLLPLVDAVVWVLDPEKYQDARLHRDHIRPHAAHADRFVFALNQIDRVPTASRQKLELDLRESLARDGIEDPRIVLTAGDPPDGLAIGLDGLVEAIRGLGMASAVVSRRIVDQLVDSADRLVASSGGGTGTGFVPRWTEARNQVAASVADAVDGDLRRTAAAVASRDAAAVSSWFGRRDVASAVEAAGTAVPAGVSEPIDRLLDATGRSLDPVSRAALVETAGEVDDEIAAVAVAVGVTTSVSLPQPPAWWSRVRLLSYGLAAVMALGFVLAVDAWRSDGAMFPGIAVAIGASVVLGGMRYAVRRSTRSRVEQAMADRRGETTQLVTAEMERRIGRPVRSTLRTRSAPGAAHTELMLAVQRYEERQG